MKLAIPLLKGVENKQLHGWSILNQLVHLKQSNQFQQVQFSSLQLEFDPSDILEVVETVIPYLSSESMLIDDVPFGVVVVADLHGQVRYEYRVQRTVGFIESWVNLWPH